MNCKNCRKRFYLMDDDRKIPRNKGKFHGRTLCRICEKGCFAYEIDNREKTKESYVNRCCYCHYQTDIKDVNVW